MSGNKNPIKQLRLWLDYGGPLLWLRLRLLRLDVVAQIRSVITLLVTALMTMILFLLGFISLLLGLNTLLSDNTKIWVFFGMAGLFCLLMVFFGVWVARLWRAQGGFMSATLDAMADDVAYLKGKRSLTSTLTQEQPHEHT